MIPRTALGADVSDPPVSRKITYAVKAATKELEPRPTNKASTSFVNMKEMKPTTRNTVVGPTVTAANDSISIRIPFGNLLSPAW